jgi:protein gp37
MEREWVRHLQDQCDDRTAFFFKQWGGVRKKETGRELDGKTHDAIPSLNA